MGRAAGAAALNAASIGILLLVVTPFFLRARNLAASRDSSATLDAASAFARSMTTRGFDPAARSLREDDPAILAVYLLAEKPSRYPFLHPLAYAGVLPDEGRAGRRLHEPNEKPLFDLATRVLLEQRAAEVRSTGGDLMAATPVPGTRDEAVVIARRTSAPVHPFPATGTTSLLVAACLLGGVLARFLPRYRALAAASVAALASLLVVFACSRALGSAATWFHTIGLLVFAAAIPLVLATANARGLLSRWAKPWIEHRVAVACLLPGATAMVALVIGPLLFGLGLSLFRRTGAGYAYVGLANFREILAGGRHALSDPLNFWFTLAVTVAWTSVNVALHMAIGLALALLLSDDRLPGRRAFRLLLVAPWAVPSYITALTWHGLFDYERGAVNTLLAFLHVPPVRWFSSFLPSFTAVVAANTWLGFPFMMVVALGALSGIPRDLQEAASVDGAGRLQTFFRITLPLLRPALVPAAILGSIWTFNMFNVIYLVSNGGPEGKTDILITEAYRWAFERGSHYGIAAAYGTIIFFLLLAYTLAAMRVSGSLEAT